MTKRAPTGESNTEAKAKEMVTQLLERFQGSEEERVAYERRLTDSMERFINEPYALGRIRDVGGRFLRAQSLSAKEMDEFLELLGWEWGGVLFGRVKRYLSTMPGTGSGERGDG